MKDIAHDGCLLGIERRTHDAPTSATRFSLDRKKDSCFATGRIITHDNGSTFSVRLEEINF